MKNEPSDRALVWTRYWSHGAETSCAGSYEGSYGKVISEFWGTKFLALNPNARILDIGTGNGPLPRILLGLETRQDLSCDAVDLARIAPAWIQNLPSTQKNRVRFHSDCAAERLPFADASFDLVISQWGLEYSDLELSAAEVLRVLKPGGGIQLLLHHADALPVRLAEEEIGHLQWLLSGSPFLDIARQMLRPMALAGSPAGRAQLASDTSANHVRNLFNSQQDVIQTRIDQGQCVEILKEVRQAIGQIFSAATGHGEHQAEAMLQSLRQTLEDSMLRLSELKKYAMSTYSANELARKLSNSGPYQLNELRDQDMLMGWALMIDNQ